MNNYNFFLKIIGRLFFCNNLLINIAGYKWLFLKKKRKKLCWTLVMRIKNYKQYYIKIAVGRWCCKIKGDVTSRILRPVFSQIFPGEILNYLTITSFRRNQVIQQAIEIWQTRLSAELQRWNVKRTRHHLVVNTRQNKIKWMAILMVFRLNIRL